MHSDSGLSAAEQFSRHCNRYTERTVLVIGVLMTLIVIVQVFSRYVLNHSLFWSEELARYLLVWLTFLGASVAYHRKMHPSVNLLQHRLSPLLKKRLRIVVYCLSLAFFSIMIWYGAEFAYFVRSQTTPALGLPKWLVFLIVPVSGALLALHAIAFLQKDLMSDGG